jgi:hypothetical protein
LSLLRHGRFWLLLGLLALDSVFFTATNSGKVASYLLIIGFLLFALTVYYIIASLLAASRFYGIAIERHQRRLALFVTGGFAGLLALQSMGELSMRDALVLLPLVVVLYIYLSYGRAKLKA